MSLSPHAHRRFWSVHAWAGVLTSLVLYVMFLLGSLVLFYKPVTVWQEPLRQQPAAAVSAQVGLDIAGELPEEFYYYLPRDGRGPLKVGYYLPGTTEWKMWWVDTEARVLTPQREQLGEMLYDLHYLWHNKTGFWLQYGGGVLVFGFLLAVVTGLLIHLRDVSSQLYRFRATRRPRVMWSDLHKVLGTIGLPFQFVYAVTGAMMALAPLLFELSVTPVFGGDAQAAAAAAGALMEDPPPPDFGPSAKPLHLDELAAKARAAEPRLNPESFVFRGYGRARGSVEVRGPLTGQPFGEAVVKVGLTSGAIEGIETPEREQSVGTVARWIHGLHTVEYGGTWMRFVVFVLGIGGCLTILTGNWIWLARRQQREASRANRILACLTTGVGAGSILALAATLLASRLMPMTWDDRAHAEELIALGVLGASTGYAFALRGKSIAWCHLLGLASVVLAVVPVAACLHSNAGLFGGGPRIADVVAVDAGILVIAALLAALALKIRVVARRPAVVEEDVTS